MTPETSGSRLVHIYMSNRLRLRLRAFQSEAAERLTHASVILTAIEETHGSLPEPAPDAEIAPPSGKLFSRPAARTGEAADKIPVGVRLREVDLKLIGDLVSTSPYRSRSAYIVASLTTYLDRVNPETLSSTETPAGSGEQRSQETPDAEL